jgi:hypothetical protein
MHVDRSQIVGILRARGLNIRADWAERTLPEIVDTKTNAGLLTTLAIDEQSLAPVEAGRSGHVRTDVTQ